ncbi:hypothetical protein [Streptomyces sp. NRRL B-1140]|uniref:hypothetical protein n=1 Tax=Streptomyces sp. NRRL B-1140 TaxID=1415549 RepID=UPI001F1A08BA|nr:hypothetical protein [Streptomyces sp. NRRL B-1140]
MAYTQARRLCALLEREDEVWLTAELRTAGEVRRMAALLPRGAFERVPARTDPVTGRQVVFDLDVTTADDAALEAHLPLDIIEEVAPGRVVKDFAAALGRGAAAIEWHGRWPDDLAAGHFGSPPYDGVQVAFHGDRAQQGRWTEEHTVFVHVTKFGDLPRARKLAAHIGSEVLGEPQLGW